MTEYDITAEPDRITIGVTGVESILQNVRIVLGTLKNSVFLDRAFARTGEALDKPEPKARALESAEIYRAIRKHEPRVQVTRIDFVQSEVQAINGKIIPRVRVKILEEYL